MPPAFVQSGEFRVFLTIANGLKVVMRQRPIVKCPGGGDLVHKGRKVARLFGAEGAPHPDRSSQDGQRPKRPQQRIDYIRAAQTEQEANLDASDARIAFGQLFARESHKLLWPNRSWKGTM